MQTVGTHFAKYPRKTQTVTLGFVNLFLVWSQHCATILVRNTLIWVFCINGKPIWKAGFSLSGQKKRSVGFYKCSCACVQSTHIFSRMSNMIYLPVTCLMWLSIGSHPAISRQVQCYLSELIWAGIKRLPTANWTKSYTAYKVICFFFPLRAYICTLYSLVTPIRTQCTAKLSACRSEPAVALQLWILGSALSRFQL